MSTEDSGLDAKRCTLTIPNDLDLLALVQSFVRTYVAALGFPPEDQARFDLLVEEEWTNVIQGAYSPGEHAFLDIVCERIPAGVNITVHDDGRPYDPSLTPGYDPDAPLEEQTGAGLGSFLLRQLADEVEFHNLGARGKDTVFVKYLESESVADAGPPAPDISAEEPDRVPQQARAAIELEPMRPEQAVEVSRCIYDAYRYTYVNESMYYPDRVAALNEGGDLLSAVATTTDGEVAGHAALVFDEDDPGVADLAMVATRPQFRGQAVARRLGEFLEEQALTRELSGLFVEQVAVHPYTQRFCHKLGFADCGILLAYSPVTSFEGIDEDRSERGSVVVGFKRLQSPEPIRLHAPARHREMIAALYEGLSVPVTFVDIEDTSTVDTRGGAAVDDEDSEPVLNSSVDTRRSVATIRIPVYAGGLRHRLRKELYRLMRQDVRVIDVFLDLRMPGTGAVAELLEELGFLFTGVRPGGRSSEWLLYQLFNGVVVDYDAIQIESEGTRRLLDYVRGNDPRVAGL